MPLNNNQNKEELDLHRRMLAPFMERAHLLDDKQLATLQKKTSIEDKITFLRRALDVKIDKHPLVNLKLDTPEELGKDFLKILSNPDNFPYTVKTLFDIDLLPFQHVILKELWTKPFPMLVMTRGGGKSWILGLYAMLRLLFEQGCKIAIVGAAFRQAKAIFEYMETFWYKGDVYRDLVGVQKSLAGREQGPRRAVDRCEMSVGNSMAFAIPLGNGDTIRGQRANYLLADEFSSIPEEIFNDAVFGFASVSAAPIEKVKLMAKVNLSKAAGTWTEEQEAKFKSMSKGNQVVLAGTADYTFGHFYKTYDLYRKVIKSGNDPVKLKDALGDKANTGMRAEDVVVIRIPASLLPPGFMDEKMMATARAKLPAAVYQKEYDATFPDDSEGFYRMSLIKSASCPIKMILEEDGEINFSPMLIGNPAYKYFLAIDPASEKDRLAVTILECREKHRRLVYTWTIKRNEHKERVSRGIVKENDYYHYCAGKIRELMYKFNIVGIACDAAGGGISIEEALANPSDKSLLPIYRVKDPEGTKNPKPTDDMQGLHILNMVQFSSAAWVSAANHGMRSDLESKTLIFPYYDLVSEALSIEEDKNNNRVIIDDTGKEIRLFDSLTSNLEEIEELKKELASITHTKTPNGRERWDLPKVKGPDGKFITETKDRYSSILMCNAFARLITMQENAPKDTTQHILGGRVSDHKKFRGSDQKYRGNSMSQIITTCGVAIRRRK